ncbi:MAG TPA: aminotransferase class III-fold pyridoxal phosphate-dependent enzyme, partial [Roseiflexaceae bacterium]|nr:aminotransferase class III-fold pyridoxal phosphate-dependent enzyme [Roseiflexaceae bacterium]
MAALPIDTACAEQLAYDAYGLQVTAHALPGEYDHNFQLHTTDGAAYVLKIMHAGTATALIDMQIAAIEHLSQRLPDAPLPHIRRTPAGATTTLLTLSDGTTRCAWLLDYLPGTPLAEVNPRSPELCEATGRLLGQLDAALADFDHPAAERLLKWDLAHAGWIKGVLDAITDPRRRALVAAILADYEAEVVPVLPTLRRSVIYNDANDYNLLVSDATTWPRTISGLIDFGDMLRSQTVCEVAIAAAYALLGAPDPMAAILPLVAGYHAEYPLTAAEIALIFPLIRMRLAVSVANSAQRKLAEPDDPYITVSEAPAWAALELLMRIHPRLAHYRLRAACGMPPIPAGERITAWLAAHSGTFAPVLGYDLAAATSVTLDLSAASLMLGGDPAAAARPALTARIAERMAAGAATYAIGRYNEARLIYQSTAFAGGERPTDERRTVHLGIDLFVAAGEPIYAPLAGTVVCVANNAAALDYGPLVILEHATDDGDSFYTLYGHLSEATLTLVREGQRVAAGERIGAIGAPPINGDWPPHLHFQIILDLLDLGRDFPGVAYASQRPVWLALSPDPTGMLGIPADRFPLPEPDRDTTLAERRARIGRNLSISYSRPLKIVRGWMQYLYDETGRAYLDIYNNVPHVGHSHPRVVAAAQAQLALLNTNTRYLHDNIIRYAERLTALMPQPLRVCFFVNSASEANELALRLARAATGQRDMIVLDAAYHGHTTSLIDISPYKFDGPGGTGRRPWVHVAPIPDDYRGLYRRDDPQAGPKYAAHVAACIDEIQATGRRPAGFIAESLPSVGGQIVLPPGYLAEVYRHVRAAGGLCIADEVQVGFGRLGSHFWGFEMQSVVPDVVVLGKPIGNAFPLAAVVTTPEIADAFDNGMEFFSTFGGNPVSCAVGLAVLDVIRDEALQARALRVGGYLIAG